MELSKLLKIEQKIKAIDKSWPGVQHWLKHIDIFSKEVSSIDHRSLELKVQEIAQSIEDFEKLRNHAIQNLSDIIDQKRQTLKNETDKIDLTRKRCAQEHQEHRKLFLTDDVLYEKSSGLIGKNANWQFPAIYFEPNTADLTRLIVHADPFYAICDMEYEIESIRSKLSENFKTRVLHYNKNNATQYFRKYSAGLCVVWKTFLFKSLNNIEKDLKFIEELLLPGALLYFDYNNAETPKGAEGVEQGLYSYITKSELHTLLNSLGFDVVTDEDLLGRSHRVCLCKKQGSLPKINLHNKLGIVIEDKAVVNSLDNIETPSQRAERLRERRLSHDLKLNAERDKILNELEEKRQLNHKKLLDDKMKIAVNRYEELTKDLGPNHPNTIESLLNVSRMAYSLGRSNDAMHTAKQAQKRARRINTERVVNLLKSIEEWIDFISKKSL